MTRFVTRGSISLALAGLVVAISLVGGYSRASAHPRRPTPTPPTVATSTTGASWTLIDNHQATCYFFPQQSTDTNYYGIWIQGTWKHSIDVGASQLPAGAVWWTSYAPIPPGSSNGTGSLAYVAIQIPSSTALGTYSASLWATDATFRESVPITLNVQSSCGHY